MCYNIIILILPLNIYISFICYGQSKRVKTQDKEHDRIRIGKFQKLEDINICHCALPIQLSRSRIVQCMHVDDKRPTRVELFVLTILLGCRCCWTWNLSRDFIDPTTLQKHAGHCKAYCGTKSNLAHKMFKF